MAALSDLRDFFQPKISMIFSSLLKANGESSRERRKNRARTVWLQKEKEGMQGSRVVLRGWKGGISQPVKACRKTNKAFSRA